MPPFLEPKHGFNMGHSNIVEPEASAKALDAVNRYIDTLFDRAPVMMHSEDREGKLIRVNRRWLQRMGYTRDEVLGRRSTEFLTAESRVRAVNDTLPLFWQVGSARSVGYRFLPKNGRMFDILLDAEVSSTSTGPLFAYAVIRKAHDPTQWEQSSTTLQGFMGLTQVRRNLESVTAIGTEAPFPGLPVVQGKPTPTLEAALASEALPRPAGTHPRHLQEPAWPAARTGGMAGRDGGAAARIVAGGKEHR